MGCCLTRHPNVTRGCLFVSNRITDDSTLTSDAANIRCQQQTADTSLDARNESVTDHAKSANGRSSEMTRQAFLDGTLDPDPRCPLDARQLYTLTKSWKVINRNLLATAINIFVRQVSTLRLVHSELWTIHRHCGCRQIGCEYTQRWLSPILMYKRFSCCREAVRRCILFRNVVSYKKLSNCHFTNVYRPMLYTLSIKM